MRRIMLVKKDADVMRCVFLVSYMKAAFFWGGLHLPFAMFLKTENCRIAQLRVQNKVGNRHTQGSR